MNIFYFDECPVKSAQAQPDKMLVKMPLETAQMLCTAHRVLDGDDYADANGLYKEAYKNHPCTIWARESWDNYQWLYKHFIALGDEYKHRYGREHASITKLKDALYFHPDNIEDKGFTPLAQAMPDECKDPDPVVAYRNCIQHKLDTRPGVFVWNKGTPRPQWLHD